MSSLLATSVFDIVQLKEAREIELRFNQIEHAAMEESLAVENIVFYTLSSLLVNLTDSRELKQQSLNEALNDKCNGSFNERYPVIDEACTVDLRKYQIRVLEDWLFYHPDGLDSSSIEPSQLPVYLRLLGSAELMINLTAERALSVKKVVRFEKQVPVPLPLFLGSIEVFRACTDGSQSDLARLVRYILTTTVQMRVLAGEGLGEGGEKDLLTESDVSSALNLALILEQARVFRAYDGTGTRALGMDSLVRGYLSRGKLDAGDLYFMVQNMDEDRIDPGRIISASLLVYSDEFVYRLLKKFWPDGTPDAVLQEPELNYSEISDLGEAWAKEKLSEFLESIRTWLMLPANLLSHFGNAEIPKITRHATSVDEISKYPVPLPVRGNYDLFTTPITARWFALAGGDHRDPGRWPPPLFTTDPIDLLLGRSSNESLLPEPYRVSFFSTFGLPKAVDYYLVNRSFIAHFADGNSTTPYFDTLKYIMETVRASIRSLDRFRPGMLDIMADDACLLADRPGPGLRWSELVEDCKDPQDDEPVLVSGSTRLIEDKIDLLLSAFRGVARGQELASAIPGTGSWFEKGLLKPHESNHSLFHLILETVDLFYELYWTLYQSSIAPAGDLDGNWAWNFPEVYYAPLDGEQVKTNESDHFNFNRDGVKHAYNNVWTVVLGHLVGSERYFHPDPVSPGKFKSATPPIPEVAWLLYGWDKYPWDPSCSNLHLWDDVKKALKPALESAFDSRTGVRFEAKTATTLLNLTSDDRKFEIQFHEFLWVHFGLEVLGPPGTCPESATESMVKVGGWLQEMLMVQLPSSLYHYVDYQNVLMSTEARAGVPYQFEQVTFGLNGSESYDFSEQFSIKQKPVLLDLGTGLSISISEPYREPRFVSVQENGIELSDVPFATSWTIHVDGCIGLGLSNLRRNIFNRDGYRQLSLTQEFRFSFLTSMTVFSGWPLGDQTYPMTKVALGELNTTFTTGEQPSAVLQRLMEAQCYLEGVVIDKEHSMHEYITTHPMGALRGSSCFGDPDEGTIDRMQAIFEPVAQKYWDELNGVIEDIYSKHNFRPIDLDLYYLGMSRDIVIAGSTRLRSYTALNEIFSSTMTTEKANESSHMIFRLVDGYLRMDLTVASELDPKESTVEFEIGTPLYKIRSCIGTEHGMPQGTSLYYEYGDQTGGTSYLIFTLNDTKDAEEQEEYLKVLRKNRYELTSLVSITEKGLPLNLPASLYLDIAEHGLNPGKITISFTRSYRSKSIIMNHSIQLEHLYGPDMNNDTCTGPSCIILKSMDPEDNNNWIVLRFTDIAHD